MTDYNYIIAAYIHTYMYIANNYRPCMQRRSNVKYIHLDQIMKLHVACFVQAQQLFKIILHVYHAIMLKNQIMHAFVINTHHHVTYTYKHWLLEIVVPTPVATLSCSSCW